MSLGNTDIVDVAQMPEKTGDKKVDVLLVTSVALSFISFWRTASIVLCDLASTAYYIGGISEQAIGKAAPWFILAVMLFVYPVTAVYMESCTMFTRGGVYRVVKGAIGRNLAKLSVSALMFDYILTGPISSVSAGKYLLGLFGDLLFEMTRHGLHPILFNATTHPELIDVLSVVCAIGITAYFWRANLKGMHESSDKALRIIQLTTVMGVLVIGWSLLSLMMGRGHLTMPPLHPVFTQSSTDPTKEASSGWLEHFPRILGALGLVVAFGHSLLAMSGEESLAQVNREIEAPKLKNLRRTGLTIFLYSLLLTGSISFLAVLLIPDGQRVMTQVVNDRTETALTNRDKTWWEVDYLRGPDATHAHDWGYIMDRDKDNNIHATGRLLVVDRSNQHVERDNGGYRDNLINGLVQSLAGPAWLKIIMEIIVVGVGFLILAGAVNTSILGSNGVMNRLAEDGVLTPWFQHPHHRFGTTHRLINMVAVVQVIVIIFSLGDVDTLGEAYAFGVVWSFVFMTLSMMVLRFKDHTARQYETPLNVPVHTRTGDIHFPIGIMVVFLILMSTAAVNLATKKTATIWGISFTGGFLCLFILAEQWSKRIHGGVHEHLEQFNQKSSPNVSVAALGLRFPNPIVVAARGPRSLPVLKKVLQEINTDKRDVVVITCKVLPPRTQGITDQERSLDDNDRDLLTRIVTVAEDVGRRVHPLVLPTNNPLYAICTAARDLLATEVVLGVSEKVHAEEQLEQFALAWGTATGDLPEGVSPPDMTVRIIGPNVEMKYEMQ